MRARNIFALAILAPLILAIVRLYPLAKPIVPLVLPTAPIGDPLPYSLPEGFVATIYSSSTPDARVIARDPGGTLIVSMPKIGKVAALPDANQDGVADRTHDILTGLQKPHGIAFWCAPTDPDRCLLFVAEENAVRSYVYDATNLKATYVEKIADLPASGGHSSRSLIVTPYNELLIASGSSCNVCIEEDERRAAILSYKIHTKELGPFANGLRNTVFMAIDPVDGRIWGTDMGRDLLGDDTPPDEVNIIERGKFYGWPYYYGKRVKDYDFNSQEIARDNEPSHIDIQAHSAPLGLAFIPEEGWPDGYGLDLLIAYHGSWNRSVPTGYKIVRLHLNPQRELDSIEDFMTGFFADGAVRGRPVGLLAEPGGVLYISDDRVGAIYRVALTEPAR